MNGPWGLETRSKFLEAYGGLFEDTLQRTGFEWPMLGDNHRYARFSQNQVGTGLADGNKSQTLQRSRGLRPADITRQFHATARMGSSRKCSRTWRGCSPGSKYPFTASATMACKSAKLSPWVVMPPPWGSSHRATNPPVSGQALTRKVISLIGVVCQPFGSKASRVVERAFSRASGGMGRRFKFAFLNINVKNTAAWRRLAEYYVKLEAISIMEREAPF